MRSTLFFLLFCYAISFGQSIDSKDFDFAKADSIAFSKKGKSLENLPLLTHELISNLPTDIEKFRAIYTWVCTNIENDYQSYLKTRKKRKKIQKDRAGFLEWNQSFTPKVFEKLVTEKRTACTGYAYLIKEMANLAGFQSEIVNGYGRTPTLLLEENGPPNHSWNTVKLDGQWYLCDATWSAGKIMIDDTGPRFEADYDDVYFLPDPNLFAKNHYPLEPSMSLLESVPSIQDFRMGPVVYKWAFTHGIVPENPQNMNVEAVRNEKVAFELKLTQQTDINKFKVTLNKGGKDLEVMPKITLLEPQRIRLEFVFNGTGLYDTHIRYGEEIITTYVVKVYRN